MDKKENQDVRHFKAGLISWFSAVIFTSAEEHWSEQRVRDHFANFPDHLRGDHTNCAPNSTCRTKPGYQLPKPNLSKASTSSPIYLKLKKIVNDVLQSCAGEILGTTFRTCSVENFNAVNTTYMPKNKDFYVSAVLRLSFHITEHNSCFTDAVMSVLKCAGIRCDQQRIRSLLAEIDKTRTSSHIRHMRKIENDKNKRRQGVATKRAEAQPFPFHYDEKAILHGTKQELSHLSFLMPASLRGQSTFHHQLVLPCVQNVRLSLNSLLYCVAGVM